MLTNISSLNLNIGIDSDRNRLRLRNNKAGCFFIRLFNRSDARDSLLRQLSIGTRKLSITVSARGEIWK